MGNIWGRTPPEAIPNPKSVVQLSYENIPIINKIYDIIKPIVPLDIKLNARGKLPREINVSPLSRDEFSKSLVDIFNGKEKPLSIMKFLPVRNIILQDIDMSSTRERSDRKNLYFGQQIGGGTYGSIHLSKYFNDDDNVPKFCVAKKTKYESDESNESNESNDRDKTNNLFIEEMLTSILLHENTKILGGVFPEIISCYNTNEGLVMQMELLNIDLDSFFQDPRMISEQIPILIIISYYIYWLQENYHFVHGDLHCRNIMLKKENFEFKIGETRIRTSYKPYFIDLGMVCVDLSRFHLTKIRVHGGPYDNSNYCQNKSQDLRLLLFCLLDDRNTPVNTFINDLFSKSKYIYEYARLFKSKRHRSHALYDDVSTIHDENFYPSYILTHLMAEESKKHSKEESKDESME